MIQAARRAVIAGCWSRFPGNLWGEDREIDKDPPSGLWLCLLRRSAGCRYARSYLRCAFSQLESSNEYKLIYNCYIFQLQSREVATHRHRQEPQGMQFRRNPPASRKDGLHIRELHNVNALLCLRVQDIVHHWKGATLPLANQSELATIRLIR